MDDTAQKQVNDSNQPPVSLVGQSPLSGVAPQSPVAGQDAASQPQVVSVGSMHKEAELAPVSDFVKLTEAPIVKDKEVAEAGVHEISQTPELTKEHEHIGIKPSAEATPVKIEPPAVDSNGNLPMNEIQATQINKSSKNIKSSVVWLAILMLKHFKQMRMNLLKKGA